MTLTLCRDKLKVLDLFSGMGGFTKGIMDAGISIDWHGYSEIDKHAKSVYRLHFPDAEDLGDVRTIQPERLPKLDLITFGFPCQDLSVAGKRGGLTALRSGLFFEAMRIVRIAKPTLFVFENVMGLFSKSPSKNIIDKREWILLVLREIADSGYDGQWQCLNTLWFLPQNRERVYFVGHIRGGRRPEVFPIGEGVGNVAEKRDGFSLGLWSEAIDSNYYKGADGKRTMIAVPLKYLNRNQKNYQEKYAFTVDSVNSGGIMEIAPCIRSEHHNTADIHFILQKNRIRRMTPLECERAQGFPDGWTEYGIDEKGNKVKISDTQRYKMLGNAVSVPVVKAVMEKIKKAMEVDQCK